MTPPRIHRLTRELVNKIAAGEVVERPASVVKELVENSIDAEASHIEITLEDGGKRLIRVVDDGIGMSPADLALAFERHATSKITATEDLFQIGTLGFRGEALASIASVSRCRAVSRERGVEEAACIEYEGGRAGEVRACGAPEGTIVEVRDLFYNVPARKKFLRTTATELRHVAEAVTRLVLPHHALAVHLMHKKKSILQLPRAGSPRERIAAVFGDDVCGHLLPVHSETAAMAFTGLISPPGEGMPSATQYVFLNGRYIRDRAIYRAVSEAYRSRLARGRFPAVFLFLLMDPGRVDVNVHPTKIEVRFRDPGAVFAQILTALERALGSAGPIAAESPAGPARQPDRRESVRQAVADFFERASRRPESAARPAGKPGTPASAAFRVHQTSQAAATAAKPSAAEAEGAGIAAPEAAPGETAAGPAVTPIAAPPMARAFCQLHDSYIVEEVPDGFVLIDQHALHERILYEELRRRVEQASVARQRLLVPEIVDLRPEDFLRVMEMKESLLEMGLEVEPFGEKTIAIHAVPHLAGTVNPRDLLLEILSVAGESAPGRPPASREALMCTIACKAAVKAGDRLTRAQVEALLEQRDRLGPEPTCPHGRPTTLRFSLRDLEKQFRRK